MYTNLLDTTVHTFILWRWTPTNLVYMFHWKQWRVSFVRVSCWGEQEIALATFLANSVVMIDAGFIWLLIAYWTSPRKRHLCPQYRTHCSLVTREMKCGQNLEPLTGWIGCKKLFNDHVFYFSFHLHCALGTHADIWGHLWFPGWRCLLSAQHHRVSRCRLWGRTGALAFKEGCSANGHCLYLVYGSFPCYLEFIVLRVKPQAGASKLPSSQSTLCSGLVASVWSVTRRGPSVIWCLT